MPSGSYVSNPKTIVNEKMQVLEDFGVCDRHDPYMKEQLMNAINKRPDKNPREVVDYFCRPMIQAKINSWK